MSFVSRLAAGEETVDEAICRNLLAIYNTRRGSGSVVRDFGLGQYDVHAADAEMLRQEIEDQTRRHEPRLTDPRIELVGRRPRGQIVFVLSGRVGSEILERRVIFDMATHAVELVP